MQIEKIKNTSFSNDVKNIISNLNFPKIKEIYNVITKCFQLKENFILQLSTLFNNYWNKSAFNKAMSMKLISQSINNLYKVIIKIKKDEKDIECLLGESIAYFIDAFYLFNFGKSN